jgi:hypothetical protein
MKLGARVFIIITVTRLTLADWTIRTASSHPCLPLSFNVTIQTSCAGSALHALVTRATGSVGGFITETKYITIRVAQASGTKTAKTRTIIQGLFIVRT